MSFVSGVKMRNFADFDSEFKELSKASKWPEIIQLGEETLKNPELSKTDCATIHVRLASSYFYLGSTTNYEKAKQHAENGHAIAEAAQAPDLIVRSLYLLSATNRALKDFVLARIQIEKADNAFKAHKLEDQVLLGKIYFNWGAAEGDDPKKPNIQLERDKYLKALECYKSTKSTDDIFRVTIRLINNAVKSKDVEFAHNMLLEIQPEMLNPEQRSAGHYYLALSRANLLKGKINDARDNAEKAVSIAERLQASVDLERAQTHLLTIPTPTIVGSAHVRVVDIDTGSNPDTQRGTISNMTIATPQLLFNPKRKEKRKDEASSDSDSENDPSCVPEKTNYKSSPAV